MTDDRLDRQIAFLLEIDKLKSVFRQTYLLNAERFENSAEHSWHVAMAAMILAEHVDEEVDLPRVLTMLLVHDIVEVDAGDTYIYDDEAAAEKAKKEQAAAARIFGLLPDDQREKLIELWRDYEEQRTPEARLAMAVDRLMPLLHNVHTQGKSWREHGVARDPVVQINSRIAKASEHLWHYVEALIDDAVAKGYVRP